MSYQEVKDGKINPEQLTPDDIVNLMMIERKEYDKLKQIINLYEIALKEVSTGDTQYKEMVTFVLKEGEGIKNDHTTT